jgi:hypothetical protein
MKHRIQDLARRGSFSRAACRDYAARTLAAALLLGAAQVHPAHGQQAATARSRAAVRHSNHHGRPATPSAADALGARIVAFAQQRRGQSVSTGECAALADAALQNAGARDAASYGEITEDADYVWGRNVALKDARPGDILQFRNYSVTTTVQTTWQFPDGHTETAQNWLVSQRPHHTAIVERNLGTSLAVLEQNAPPAGRAVQELALPVTSMRYTNTTNDGVPATVLTTVQVDGEIRVYRPQRATRS